MKVSHIFITSMLMLALTPQGFAASASSSFKCWTNKDGVRECGNEVPPEYAQGQTRTINKKGITTNVEERARSTEEVEKERREKEAAAVRAAEEKRKQEQQATYDRVLLNSYLKEEEIIAARDRKLSAIDASIELTNTTIGKLEEKLTKEEQRAESLKKNGKEPSAAEKKDMDALQTQIANRKGYVANRLEEKQAITVEYDGYLNRFRELKGSKAPQ